MSKKIDKTTEIWGTDAQLASRIDTLANGTVYYSTNKLTLFDLDSSVGQAINSKASIDYVDSKTNSKQDKVAVDISDSTSIAFSASTNFYRGEEASLTFDVSGLANIDDSSFIAFDSGNTATAITVSSTTLTLKYMGTDCDSGVFIPLSNKHYELLFTRELNDTIRVMVNGQE